MRWMGNILKTVRWQVSAVGLELIEKPNSATKLIKLCLLLPPLSTGYYDSWTLKYSDCGAIVAVTVLAVHPVTHQAEIQMIIDLCLKHLGHIFTIMLSLQDSEQ